jgi:hypothetical protein
MTSPTSPTVSPVTLPPFDANYQPDQYPVSIRLSFSSASNSMPSQGQIYDLNLGQFPVDPVTGAPYLTHLNVFFDMMRTFSDSLAQGTETVQLVQKYFGSSSYVVDDVTYPVITPWEYYTEGWDSIYEALGITYTPPAS